VVAGGGREARQVHHRARPWLLELSPKASRYYRHVHLCARSWLLFNFMHRSSARGKKKGAVQFSSMHDYVPYHVCLLSRRAAAVRQELQAEVDQLPEAGPEEGKLLAAGGGPHRRAPQGAWEQVINQSLVVRRRRRPALLQCRPHANQLCIHACHSTA
jgi:hypothetical protein